MSGFYLPSEDDFDPSIDDFPAPQLCKERRYKHFDLPLSKAERESFNIRKITEAPRFFPLLGFTDKARRYGSDEEGVRKITLKNRPIRFASHQEAAYLQAYAGQLSCYYEQALKEGRLGGSVLAYRQGGGTNIHHAKSLFNEIRSRGNCSVFALDISGFFDCLDHGMLRDELSRLLDVAYLTGHHGSVWKNITRYSWVETEHLDKLLGKKRDRQGRICSPQDFIDHVQGRKEGLVNTHDLDYGIPQGTPVSGLYANLYLRRFDHEVAAVCAAYGGSYRRYSDDIAIVLPFAAKVERVIAVAEKMLGEYALTLSSDKTDFALFQDGRLASPSPIQYLGFTFDGERIHIRDSSMDAYRHKMKKGIHAKMVAAKAKGVPSFRVYKRESLSRYTHLGKRRNFLRYAHKAAEILESHDIKRQVRKHMTWFNRTWDREAARVFGDLVME